MTSLSLAWLDPGRLSFPPAEEALSADSGVPGLLAAGGDLSISRLREAYRHGVFPWFSDGQPILWWSPDPRMVLPVESLRVSRSLRKTLQRFAADPRCAVRVDGAFRKVIHACAGTPRPGQDGTWIVREMVDAYTDWHARGDVHSFETWVDGELVGGLYGVGIGRMFFGESMFSHRTDASKIALAALVAFCRRQGIELIDCQQRTEHLASLGAREVPRSQFIRHVREAVGQTPVTDWRFAPSMWGELPGVLAPAEAGPTENSEAAAAPPPHFRERSKG